MAHGKHYGYIAMCKDDNESIMLIANKMKSIVEDTIILILTKVEKNKNKRESVIL